MVIFCTQCSKSGTRAGRALEIIYVIGYATLQAKIMSKLNHPNIINCYDSFEEDGTIWIEMEYADGG
jgi:serine/threonine protein kinase